MTISDDLMTPSWARTSAAMVAALLRHAALTPGMEVLNPTAGTGDLASVLHGTSVVVDCIDPDPVRADALRLSGEARNVTTAAFLDVPAVPNYDAVVMHPPWGDEADLDHVRHAAGFVRPGGTVVAVLEGGVLLSTSISAVAFRDQVEEMGGWMEPMPGEADRYRSVLLVLPVDGEGLAADLLPYSLPAQRAQG